MVWEEEEEEEVEEGEVMGLNDISLNVSLHDEKETKGLRVRPQVDMLMSHFLDMRRGISSWIEAVAAELSPSCH
mgnify:CR=1 FL=1